MNSAPAVLNTVFLIGLPALGIRPNTPQVPPVQDKPQRVQFAPGVRIDWGRRTVEVDAEIVLREGPLELLACSPQTREHESILRAHARPMHIHQAMGLIGLEPGAPVRYDEQRRAWLAPTGSPVKLRIRCDVNGRAVDVAAHEWLRDVNTNRPPRVNWVFAGSRSLRNGRYGADLDGTVVCVVDFETALITVDALHSADNELLWLRANPDAIPPVGTTCTLVISSAGPEERAGRKRPTAIQVDLLGDGSLRQDNAAVSAEELAKAVRAKGADAAFPRLVIRVSSNVAAATILDTVEALVTAGLDRAALRVVRAPSDKPDAATQKEPAGPDSP